MSDGNYSYVSDSSERVANELNILNTWMAQIVETGLPQISAQLAEIWENKPSVVSQTPSLSRRSESSRWLAVITSMALAVESIDVLMCLSQVSALLEAFRKLMSPLISRAAF